MSELPNGWLSVPLGQIIKPSSEKVEPSDVPDAYYLSLEHVEADTRRVIGKGLATDVRSTKSVFKKGDVLYGKLRPYLNKVCCPEFDGVCSTDFLVFKQSDAVDSRYLMYLLNRKETVKYAHHLSVGVQLPRISFNDLASFEVALAPLNEQKRIVTKLDELLPKVEACKQRLEKIPTILKRFRQSVLADAMSGKLTKEWRKQNGVGGSTWFFDLLQIHESKNSKGVGCTDRFMRNGYSLKDATAESHDLPSGWVKAPVGLLCECIVPGRDKPKSFSGTVPWITLPELRGDVVPDEMVSNNLSEEEIAEVNARVIPPNSVIMSCIGRFGISALVQREVVINQQLHCFLESNVILPKFLMYQIRCLVEYMTSVATSTTIAYLNKANCNSLPIRVPPLNEQEEIVRRVDQLMDIATSVERRAKNANRFTSSLGDSLLQRAFSGTLVSQDPTDEPAALLLERIKSSAPTAKQKKAPSGKRKAPKEPQSLSA